MISKKRRGKGSVWESRRDDWEKEIILSISQQRLNITKSINRFFGKKQEKENEEKTQKRSPQRTAQCDRKKNSLVSKLRPGRTKQKSKKGEECNNEAEVSTRGMQASARTETYTQKTRGKNALTSSSIRIRYKRGEGEERPGS